VTYEIFLANGERVGAWPERADANRALNRLGQPAILAKANVPLAFSNQTSPAGRRRLEELLRARADRPAAPAPFVPTPVPAPRPEASPPATTATPPAHAPAPESGPEKHVAKTTTAKPADPPPSSEPAPKCAWPGCEDPPGGVRADTQEKLKPYCRQHRSTVRERDRQQRARAPKKTAPKRAAPKRAASKPARPTAPTVPAVPSAPAEQAIRRVCQQLADMLVEKNRAYGNSALDPARVFSKADRLEQLRVRMDDKLSRIQRGHDAGEDPYFDLAGYLIIYLVARGQAAGR
jgi:hypothetical protein